MDACLYINRWSFHCHVNLWLIFTINEPSASQDDPLNTIMRWTSRTDRGGCNLSNIIYIYRMSVYIYIVCIYIYIYYIYLCVYCIYTCIIISPRMHTCMPTYMCMYNIIIHLKSCKDNSHGGPQHYLFSHSKLAINTIGARLVGGFNPGKYAWAIKHIWNHNTRVCLKIRPGEKQQNQFYHHFPP